MWKSLQLSQSVRSLSTRPSTAATLSRRSATSNSRLDLQAIDTKWQQLWALQGDTPNSPRSPKKSYVLPMFAYPSGSLHMGHLRVYTISDVIARYRRMQGYQVLHPTGWDAFGLPAENAAIERGIDPAVWTEENIVKMKKQLQSMNTTFDWDAEISTCSPSFYKHTQSIFLKLYSKGLAYQAEALVNYDPVDKTVLANEQVDSQGRSWRSGALVQQMKLRQWFFRITSFKEFLLKDLDYLGQNDKWPSRVLTQQRNWIGKSSGARIKFNLQDPSGLLTPVHVFTTRPDTIFGVKFITLSLSHPLVLKLVSTTPGLQQFLDKRATFAPDSKEGFELPLRALSPLSEVMGAPLETIPVFTAPYVLEGYGDGAVMGVPAHDSRDLGFWKVHRPEEAIPMVVTGSQPPPSLRVHPNDMTEAFTSPGTLTSLCGQFAGLSSQEGSSQILQLLQKTDSASPFETWRLRDWLVSRQRYWGTPIPIIHCAECGTVPVPEDDLPVELPRLDASFKGQRGNPLDKIQEWVNCQCPQCHGPAKRETDTMDTFVDSSWYFLRFPDPQNTKEPFSQQSASEMVPVDTYIGGVEHAILHLLYARFMYKFLCGEGLIDGTKGQAEPFQSLIAQGMVHGKTFSDPDTGRFLLPNELEETEQGMIVKATKKAPTLTWEKMSKSKHNGVDPSVCIEKFGADALRAHILFAAPVSEVLQWDEEKIVGIQRWLGRVWRIVNDLAALATAKEMDTVELDVAQMSEVDANAVLLTHGTRGNIVETFSNNIYSLNTAISDLIKLTNGLHDTGVSNLSPQVANIAVKELLKMMAPITPAFSEECWEVISSRGPHTSIFEETFVTPILSEEQESALRNRRTTMVCAVQINGKMRFTADIPPPKEGHEALSKADRETEIVSAVLKTKSGQSWLTEKHDWEKRKRVVVVGGGKVLNVVF
ncbi:leucine-tRNA ligase [Exophiala mesophila]|uniref:leucine--tRNA ligase n=1 Tax=Exophiala mesophila TaxID=212818 RepID=A0A0D1XM24_EXOME|nr:leucine-tRNA ligase [Exophiala mesophila]KIV89221.1 leucine-tRNA ligase [Exophiala mesophila]